MLFAVRSFSLFAFLFLLVLSPAVASDSDHKLDTNFKPPEAVTTYGPINSGPFPSSSDMGLLARKQRALGKGFFREVDPVMLDLAMAMVSPISMLNRDSVGEETVSGRMLKRGEREIRRRDLDSKQGDHWGLEESSKPSRTGSVDLLAESRGDSRVLSPISQEEVAEGGESPEVDSGAMKEGDSRKYQHEDSVTLWVNKVGPYNNPQETYNYYSLPFCQPSENAAHKWGGLGEVLGGNELIDSKLDIKFQKTVDKSPICDLKLDAAKVKQFKDAIENTYWFEFFVGMLFMIFFLVFSVYDLPLWGFVGELRADKNSDNNKPLLYTHKIINVKFNGDQIIHVNLTQDTPKSLEVGKTLEMTYSVKWVPTNITFARRFDIYLDYPFFEHQIHWFSIFNSFMMVIFLTGLVSMILMRTLRNDYAKYAREDDDLEPLENLKIANSPIGDYLTLYHQERDVSEESGWKLVHGDVFRPPRNLVLLSAVVGTGAQLAMLVLLVILLAIIGMLYIGRGAIVTTFIVCYALTSFISGYVSGGLYSRSSGKSWIKSMILTASLFPFMCFGIGFILNTIAIFYGSLAAIPFGTMVVVFIIWAFISFPLALLGTVVGRNWSGAPNNPCRVKTIPRPIPEKKWYLTPSVVSLMGGLLPFGSIFIEMYFVFTSFWNYKVYYVYGFMLLVFLILVIVTICVTIVGTYFLLNAENYHWQWTSFFSAASTAVYVYLYSIYYYYVKTKMSGFFQTSFYFGYTLMFCLGLGILCGAVGYLGSTLFVRRIYRNIKCD
ncbi:hypothetical protein HHK36_004448 [Tetracentron sinense]|uniref:Transmembrane 9 superfamily member n=1 Tax=Tetracentron sinense TaxID=13715 RepID=A0A834ZQX9_TETSI|nr:hypothetical protein HHK36_004448 [Tetracentron sinense]